MGFHDPRINNVMMRNNEKHANDAKQLDITLTFNGTIHELIPP